jgi:D-threonate/D-erythronate kinase
VWAGSAGLAAALAEIVAGAAPRTPPAPFPVTDGPVLVVAGSIADETLAQVDLLLDSTPMGVVAVTAASLVAGGERAGAETERAAAALASLLMAGGDGILHVVGEVPQAAGPCIAHALATIVREASAPVRPAGLVLTGGETARAVCDALGVGELELLGEVEPGIPLSVALITRPPGAASSSPVVTKAGAFGGPEALLRSCATLHGRTLCPAP